jgi:hypothetical protein
MIYTDGTPIDPELKKLPALLDELSVSGAESDKWGLIGVVPWSILVDG